MMKKTAKKTPNKAMPVGKKSAGGYAPKKLGAKAKTTGKKKMPSAKKSKISDSISKIKF